MENVKGKILAKTLMQHVCMMADASAKQSLNSDNNSIGQQAKPSIANVFGLAESAGQLRAWAPCLCCASKRLAPGNVPW